MRNVVYSLALAVGLSVPWISSAASKNLANFGPQVRVAVAQFGATDRFTATYGGWNIGGGLAAQLVTSLIDSKRVVVVERAILSKVLMEQELGQSRLSSPMTQTSAGQLLGVDYLIVGEVTEFEERELSSGAALAIMKGIGPKVSSDISAAHVGIDMRVIDTRTGEILHSHRAQGKAWGKTLGVKLTSGMIDFGGELFHKTPLGKATRRAISNAVSFILEVVESQTKDYAWLARVINTEGSFVYIDAGKLSNVAVGDMLKIINVDKLLTDPETNEILGVVEREAGLAQAVEVEGKYTKAKLVGTFPVSVGCLVRFATDKESQIAKISKTGYKVME